VALTAAASFNGALICFLNAGEDILATGEEYLDRRCALLLVAGDARRHEIARPVRTAARPGDDVVEVKRGVDNAAIGAAVSAPLQNVFPSLVAGERSPLVLDAGYLRVFEQLHVEAHPLDGNPGDRHPTA
jgi:hypothetical protein